MTTNKGNEITPLKKTMNPKSRGNIVELNDLDIKKLTPREKVLLRVINSLEEQLDKLAKIAAD